MNMRDITRREIGKLRGMQSWRTVIPFVPPQEINKVRRQMVMSGIKFKTEQIQRNGRFVGYRVKILE